jgi:transposase InsO family protein
MIIQDALSSDLHLSISEPCRSLEVSRSGYSYWLKRPESVPWEDIDLRNQIQENIYLAVIIDLSSRKCIGWDLSRNMGSQLTMNALDRALKSRWTESIQGLIHHSDQGVQYASKDYVDCLRKHNIKISMSRKGNPYDNAFAESFIETLKVEEVYLNEYETFEDAFRNIQHFIETVYNRKRLHSALGYRSPDRFESEVALNTVA